MKMQLLMMAGFFVSAIGVWMVLRAGKNEFNRMDHGVERFKSHEEMAALRALDWILRILGFIVFCSGGYMMFIAAVKPTLS